MPVVDNAELPSVLGGALRLYVYHLEFYCFCSGEPDESDIRNSGGSCMFAVSFSDLLLACPFLVSISLVRVHLFYGVHLELRNTGSLLTSCHSAQNPAQRYSSLLPHSCRSPEGTNALWTSGYFPGSKSISFLRGQDTDFCSF